MARFCSILGVRVVRVRGRCHHQAVGRVNVCGASKWISFHLHTSHVLFDGVVLVRGLVLSLLTGTFVGALPLEGSRDDGGWDWESRIMTSPLHCSLPLRTNQNGSVLIIIRICMNAYVCKVLFYNIQQCQGGQDTSSHRCEDVRFAQAVPFVFAEWSSEPGDFQRPIRIAR